MGKLRAENILQHLPQKYYVINVEKKEIVQSNDPDVRTGKCYNSLFDKNTPCGEVNRECTCEQMLKKVDAGDFLLEKGEGQKKQFFKASFKKLDDNLVIANYTDITEELRSKKEIKINTKRLERAERLVDFGYWEFSIDDKLMLSSKGARKVYGVDRKVIPLEEIQKMPLPEYRDMLDQKLHDLIENYESYNVKFKIKRPSDGEIRCIHSIAEFREDKRMVFGVINDITEKIQSEKALEESLIDLKLAQQIAKVGNWKADPETGKQIWSEEIYQIFERDSKLGPVNADEYTQYYSEQYAQLLIKVSGEAVNEGKPFDLQFKLQLKNGKEKWVEVICQPDKKKGPAGHFLRGTIQDITYSKNTEEELNRTNRLLRTVIDLIPDSIYMKDSNYRKVIANKGDAEHCGVKDVSEILGKSDYDLYPKQIADNYNRDDRRVIENGEEIINREEQLPGEEKNRWILTTKIPLRNDNNEITGLVGIGRDITEFKEQESQLKMFHTIIEQSPLSIMITDQNGNIEYTNQGFTKITGYNKEEVIGHSARILQSGKHDDAFFENLWDTIWSGKDWHGEMQNRKNNGTLYWENAVITPVFDENKEIKHFVSISEDVSEKKQMIKDLEIARDKAEESDRLKSLFLANMSHEIRTPLNGILGFSNVISSGTVEEKDKLDYYGTIIQNCGDRLVTVIDDIIDISMIQSNQLKIEKKNFNLNELLEEVFTLYNSQKKEELTKIEFDVTLCSDPNHNVLYSDKNRVFQVLKNLLDNAFKFTESGFIKFGCSPSTADELILYVQDSGIGVDKSKQKMIFESFRQAEEGNSRKFDGSGLGLAIISGILERLGGKVWLESELGKGSTFFVSLPRTTNNESKSFSSEGKKNMGNVNGKDKTVKHILSVEDDSASIEYLKSVVESMGHEFVNFVYAGEAIEHLRKNKVDLIFMDVQLPKMNGYEATRKIKSEFSNLPVIIQTAYAMKGDKEKAINAGCDDYLSKPVDLNKLKEQIKKYVGSA